MLLPVCTCNFPIDCGFIECISNTQHALAAQQEGTPTAGFRGDSQVFQGVITQTVSQSGGGSEPDEGCLHFEGQETQEIRARVPRTQRYVHHTFSVQYKYVR